MGINAGLVMVTEFCSAGDSTFGNYINYIDRDEATRKEVLPAYNLFKDYMDYMDDTEKTSGLFTKSGVADLAQKKALKEAFKMAQDNGSLMWQTVISFDNRWLADQGVFDPCTKRLDENKLQAATTAAMNTLLEKEGLSTALWTAAIHYNTDNIHVHVATVEPVPMREKKEYLQWEKEKVKGKMIYKKRESPETGKWEKIPVLDPGGKQVRKEEYIGVFKQKNIKAAKSEVFNTLNNSKEITIEINSIIRDNILGHVKEHGLYNDKEFRDGFEALHQELVKRGSRNMWNYNQNIIAGLRPAIDELSMRYIEKYHKEDYARLEVKLERQEQKYMAAYGKSNNYKANKMLELNERLGNVILKEVRALDEKRLEQETETESVTYSRTYKRIPEQELRRSLNYLRRSLKDGFEHYLNQQDFQELQNSIAKDMDLDL